MNRILALATNLFPVWVLLGGALALVEPAWFTWFSGGFITWGLAVIMLGMGMTLSVDDCKRVLKMPRAVGIGFAAQYLIMPFLGWSIAHLAETGNAICRGLDSGFLLSRRHGVERGQLPCSLQRGVVGVDDDVFDDGRDCDDAAADEMARGPVCAGGCAGPVLEHAEIVLAPVVIGVALNRYVPRFVKFVLPVSPLISVLAIVLICASIIGSSADKFKQSGGVLVAGGVSVARRRIQPRLFLQSPAPM